MGSSLTASWEHHGSFSPPNQFLESSGFFNSLYLPGSGEVVAPTLLPHLRISIDLDDESPGQELLDGSVESSRPKLDGSIRAALDLLHDSVSVALTVGQSQEDMELG